MAGPIKRTIDNADSYSTRLLKMLPTETVTVCLAAMGVVFASTEPGGVQTGLLWTIFIVGLGCTPLWLIYGMEVKKPLQIIVTSIAFIIWMMSIKGPFSTISGYPLIVGSVLLILYSGFVAPLLGLISKSQASS